MSEPVSNVEIEDVLSSIRRLVSEENRPLPRQESKASSDKLTRLVLTPSLLVPTTDSTYPAEDKEESAVIRTHFPTDPDEIADRAEGQFRSVREDPNVTGYSAVQHEPDSALQVVAPDDELLDLSSFAQAGADQTDLSDAPWKDPEATLFEAAEAHHAPESAHDDNDADIEDTDQFDDADTSEGDAWDSAFVFSQSVPGADDYDEDQDNLDADDLQADKSQGDFEPDDANPDQEVQDGTTSLDGGLQDVSDEDNLSTHVASSSDDDEPLEKAHEIVNLHSAGLQPEEDESEPDWTASPQESEALAENAGAEDVVLEDTEEIPAEAQASVPEDVDFEASEPEKAAIEPEAEIVEIEISEEQSVEPEEDAAEQAETTDTAHTVEAAEDEALDTEESAVFADGSAEIDDVTSTATLSAKIAVLEAKIGQTPDQWEPDGETNDDYAGTTVETIQWQDHEAENQEAASAPFTTVEQPAPTPDQAEQDGDDVLDILPDEETILDEESLRELVADIVRQELQGALGERITRNVRKLVRREIHRALTSQELD